MQLNAGVFEMQGVTKTIYQRCHIVYLKLLKINSAYRNEKLLDVATHIQ